MGCSPSERKTDFGKGAITSYDQFYDAIAKGSTLAVLEDAVIDLSTFLKIHPGGPEVLSYYAGMLSLLLSRDGNK